MRPPPHDESDLLQSVPGLFIEQSSSLIGLDHPAKLAFVLGQNSRCRPRCRSANIESGTTTRGRTQHFLYHLVSGIAGFVLANGVMSSNQSTEEEIKKNTIEANLGGCINALPGQLFRSTPMSVCLWFLRKGRGDRELIGETLFIDAR